jgi:hypothetical protein
MRALARCRQIPNEEEETFARTIDKLRVSPHGAPEECVIDGESGVAISQTTNQNFARQGVMLHARAEDQHARFVDRRGTLLRDTIHFIAGQLHEEGAGDISFSSVRAEAVFRGNALLSVDGSTPDSAVYGRVPRLLPTIDHLDAPDESSQPSPDFLCEISAVATFEGLPRARLGCATNTRTTMASQHLNLHVGEEVGFFRSPATKDAFGRFGPAEVIDVSRTTRGIISIRSQSCGMEVHTKTCAATFAS